MANMNLIGVFVTKLWPVQALACGGATKNIISPKFSNFRGYNYHDYRLVLDGEESLLILGSPKKRILLHHPGQTIGLLYIHYIYNVLM